MDFRMGKNTTVKVSTFQIPWEAQNFLGTRGSLGLQNHPPLVLNYPVEWYFVETAGYCGVD